MESRRKRKAVTTEAGDSTKNKILCAAQQLFAKKGFAGVSVRDVGEAADVPIALITYHFETKARLYKEIFSRRGTLLMNQSRDLLQAVTLSGNCKSDVAQIVTALVEPVLRSRDTEDQLTFLTLFGREMLDPLEAERGIVSELFDPTAQATLALLRTAAPHASPKDVCWVYFFAVGAAAVSHANPARVERLSSGLCQPSNVEEVGSELIRFITSAWLGVLFPNNK